MMSNDVFVPEPPYDPGLALEKLEESRVADGQVGQKHLHGDLTPGAQVDG